MGKIKMIANDLKTVINDSWNTAKLEGKTKEPELAAAFMKALLSQHTVSEIARSLSSQLPKDSSLVVRGIFAHQNPYANFKNSKNEEGKSELADLVLLREHVADGGNVQKRGFLIQAKSKEQPNTGAITDSREIRQFELYASWPKFKLTKSFLANYKAFSPPTGDINFATGYNSQQSRYGIVANKEAVLASAPWGEDCAWVICQDTLGPPSHTATSGAVFEASMDDVLQRFFHFGWGRDYGAAQPGDWTQFLEFLSKLVKADKFQHSLVQNRAQESRARVQARSWQDGRSSFMTRDVVRSQLTYFHTLNRLGWIHFPPSYWVPFFLGRYRKVPVSILYIGTTSPQPWTHD
ncbi:hypothetical protein ABH945_000709 [Paraburkholderia sp. GAS333]|uniref:hypothetical protein n=1 Tax=Paraburkholderia sp. GAS333 TaxID=3156279 RepID=UPI003D1A68E6